MIIITHHRIKRLEFNKNIFNRYMYDFGVHSMLEITIR